MAIIAQFQGANIWRYSEYLIARSLAFSETKTDYVRNGQGRLKSLTVSKGLLRETEIVQKQIKALLKCDVRIYCPAFVCLSGTAFANLFL